MWSARLWLIVLACVVAGVSDAGVGAQGPYKSVEWPAPATNAAGFAAPWNLIQASSVASSREAHVLVFIAARQPILEFDTSGKFIRSWGEGSSARGKVAAFPRELVC